MSADGERGRKLLRELLPWAKAEARKGDAKFEALSALGNAQTPHVTLDNLDALMIYPAPLGGWHADIVLKRTPPGVPNVLGTPVGQPLRTRREAEECGKNILVMVCAMAAKPAPPADPVFLLQGYVLPLLPDLYQAALAIMPQGAGGPGGGFVTKQRAIQRIEETLAELCPDGFNGEAFNTWSDERKAELLTVIHIAALTGVYAYPPRLDATPSGHRDVPETRH